MGSSSSGTTNGFTSLRNFNQHRPANDALATRWLTRISGGTVGRWIDISRKNPSQEKGQWNADIAWWLHLLLWLLRWNSLVDCLYCPLIYVCCPVRYMELTFQ